MALGVLFVCTGNICRSPMAERLFRARLARPADVATCSAGTLGLVGAPMDATTGRVLRELGGDPDGHVARLVTPTLVEAADLVLTATAEHRATLLAAAPLAFRRTFTLREFARLGDVPPGPQTDGSADALRELVGAAAARRGSVPPVAANADDIADPFGAPLDFVRLIGTEVAAAVDGVLRALGIGPARV